eukprot:2232764-Pyramimonas_sp.AAC.1
MLIGSSESAPLTPHILVLLTPNPLTAPLPSTLSEYTLSPLAIGPPSRNIPSPLAIGPPSRNIPSLLSQLVPPPGIYPLFLRMVHPP